MSAISGKSNRGEKKTVVSVAKGAACRPIDIGALMRFNPFFRENPEHLKRLLGGIGQKAVEERGQ